MSHDSSDPFSKRSISYGVSRRMSLTGNTKEKPSRKHSTAGITLSNKTRMVHCVARQIHQHKFKQKRPALART